MGAMSAGLNEARRRWRLVLALAALNVAASLFSARPLSTALQPVIDSRPAAVALIDGDDGLASELLADHPELLREATGGAEGALLVWGLLAWLIAGGVAGTSLERTSGARATLGAVGEHAWRMVKVGLFGLPLRVVPIGAAVGAWYALKPLWRDRGFAQLAIAALIVAALFAVLWSLATTALDFARGLAIAQPELRSWRAVARGMQRLWQRRELSIKLVAFAGGGFLALTVGYHALAAALPNAPVWSFALLAALRLLVAFGRSFLTTTALIAATGEHPRSG